LIWLVTKPRRAISRCNSAETFGGSAEPSGVCSVARRSAALPAVQHRKQPFRARVQLLARLTLNPGKHTGNQPARLAELDDGNDRAILVEGDEGPAQSLPRRRPG
jgi:hypothetical protein